MINLAENNEELVEAPWSRGRVLVSESESC